MVFGNEWGLEPKRIFTHSTTLWISACDISEHLSGLRFTKSKNRCQATKQSMASFWASFQRFIFPEEINHAPKIKTSKWSKTSKVNYLQWFITKCVWVDCLQRWCYEMKLCPSKIYVLAPHPLMCCIWGWGL